MAREPRALAAAAQAIRRLRAAISAALAGGDDPSGSEELCADLAALRAAADDGWADADKIAAFAAAIMLLARPLKRLAKVYGVLQTALVAGRRIFNVLDEEPKVAERPNAETLPLFRDKVVFDRVSFKYTDTEVLKDMSLEAKKGEIIAIVGPSGVGKTTLVNLIPRFYDISSGAVLIDGHNVRDVTLKSLIDNIGIVTQDTILFNDTVSANIGYGMIGADKDSILNAAKIANAH